MFTEVAEVEVAVEQGARRLGDDDLAAVASCTDPGGAVNIHADVALVRQPRLARVQSHADADRPRSERALGFRRGGHRVGGAGENDEEAVPLRVGLDSAVALEGIAQQPVVLGQNVGVALAELV